MNNDKSYLLLARPLKLDVWFFRCRNAAKSCTVHVKQYGQEYAVPLGGNMYALSRIKRKNCGARVENFLTCVLIPTSIHYTCNISEVSLVDFGGSGAKSSDTRKMSKQNTVRVTARSSAV